MKKLQFTLPAYMLGDQTLQGAQMESQTLPLKPGRQDLSTGRIRILTKQGRSLEAQVRIPYRYSEAGRYVQIAAPEYTGEDSISISLYENDRWLCQDEANPQKCLFHSAVRGWDRYEHLKSWMEETRKSVYQQVCQAVQNEKLMVLTRCNFTGAEDANGEPLRVMYRDGWFQGFYDGNVPDDGDLTIVPLGSVFGGTGVAYYGTQFWNVIGSTSDTKPDNDGWKWFWYNNATKNNNGWARLRLDVPDSCIADCTDPTTGRMIQCGRGSMNNRDLVGGHIVFNADSVRPKEASGEAKPDGIVALLPICRGHNSHYNTNVMTVMQTCPFVWLDQYDGKY